MDCLARRFKQFAELECRGYSPLYERLSRGIAADPALLELAAQARPGQPVPNLFLAAAHYLLLQGADHPLAAFYPSLTGPSPGREDPYPHFRSFCLARREEILPLIRTQFVQTNVVGRCACLVPAFGVICQQLPGMPPDLSLLEIGAAAGLNLLWDRYGYRYGDGQHCGDLTSPVQLSCSVRGTSAPPLLSPFPRIAYRVGLDFNPIDVFDRHAISWLRALVWPEHQDRALQLQQAIELAQRDPPELIAGDALESLLRVVAAAPADGALCVFHTHTVNQFSPEARQHLLRLIMEASAQRVIYLVSMEWTGLESSEDVSSGHSLLKLTTCAGGDRREQRLGYCDAHGRWIEWLGPEVPA